MPVILRPFHPGPLRPGSGCGARVGGVVGVLGCQVIAPLWDQAAFAASHTRSNASAARVSASAARRAARAPAAIPRPSG